MPNYFSISIISHDQISLVSQILDDLTEHISNNRFEVILTINIPELLPDSLNKHSFPIIILNNATPLGFGENHNRAFQHASGDFFCVLNPDIRLTENPFPLLISNLQDTSIGVVAPLVLDSNGTIEDSARHFPTPFSIGLKALGMAPKHEYTFENKLFYPDWTGGMFLLFRRDVYAQINGFNQKFFLYYEDVDLCARIWNSRLKVALNPNVSIIHLARRTSHRNLRYLLMHLKSMLSFFISFTFVKVLFNKRFN
jgi:N-acetylglucosaminyl-diphospho-decaprenol L-rhamnosyltransferase